MTATAYKTLVHPKIHRARVTSADLHFVGSITIDADLLDTAADVGDIVIVMAYAQVPAPPRPDWHPVVLYMDPETKRGNGGRRHRSDPAALPSRDAVPLPPLVP